MPPISMCEDPDLSSGSKECSENVGVFGVPEEPSNRSEEQTPDLFKVDPTDCHRLEKNPALAKLFKDEDHDPKEWWVRQMRSVWLRNEFARINKIYPAPENSSVPSCHCLQCIAPLHSNGMKYVEDFEPTVEFETYEEGMAQLQEKWRRLHMDFSFAMAFFFYYIYDSAKVGSTRVEDIKRCRSEMVKVCELEVAMSKLIDVVHRYSSPSQVACWYQNSKFESNPINSQLLDLSSKHASDRKTRPETRTKYVTINSYRYRISPTDEIVVSVDPPKENHSQSFAESETNISTCTVEGMPPVIVLPKGLANGHHESEPVDVAPSTSGPSFLRTAEVVPETFHSRMASLFRDKEESTVDPSVGPVVDSIGESSSIVDQKNDNAAASPPSKIRKILKDLDSENVGQHNGYCNHSDSDDSLASATEDGVLRKADLVDEPVSETVADVESSSVGENKTGSPSHPKIPTNGIANNKLSFDDSYEESTQDSSLDSASPESSQTAIKGVGLKDAPPLATSDAKIPSRRTSEFGTASTKSKAPATPGGKSAIVKKVTTPNIPVRATKASKKRAHKVAEVLSVPSATTSQLAPTTQSTNVTASGKKKTSSGRKDKKQWK